MVGSTSKTGWSFERRSTLDRAHTCRALGAIASALLLGALSCTEPAEREQLRVRIEADEAVRALVDEVSAVIETSNPNGGWQLLDSQRFEPKVRHPWPLDYVKPVGATRVNFQLTAIAKDEASSVVATARALRDWDAPGSPTLHLLFESSCIRLPKVCANGQTCHAGDCVDAHFDYSAIKPTLEPVAGSGPAGDAGPDPGGPILAVEGEPCESDSARACTGEQSRTPLLCQGGAWQPASVCSEDQLCDTTMGAQRGSCRKVAAECLGHDTNELFCDRDIMRVCESMFASKIRDCGLNERCISPQAKARCDCKNGFVNYDDGAGCREPIDCTVNNGGCDPLTSCTMDGQSRKCTACPTGYVGDGLTGCEPLLAGLVPSIGQLTPNFEPGIYAYRVRVPLLGQRITLMPAASSEARIEANGTTVAAGQGWTSPTLPLGEFPIKLTLTSASGSTSEYDIIVERAAAQSAYLKANNSDSLDMFGMMVAMSGDTLVVGAAFEDSNAKTIDGDGSNNDLQDSGAAYVFVRRGENWEQQAYLKPTDPLTQDYFGLSVAISGDTIVVGAVRSDFLGLSPTTPRPGVAYVFTRKDGKWSQTARLSPASGAAGDEYGYNLAIEGDLLAVGAPRDAGSGAVYVYVRNGNDWQEQQKVKPAPTVANGMFGSALAISKDSLIVGASADGTEKSGAGSAYVFTPADGHWAQSQRLTGDPISTDASFGYVLAMSGDYAIIGAPRVKAITGDALVVMVDPGEAFVFHREVAGWKQTQRLQAMLPRQNDSFGSSVAMLGGNALIGACGDASGATTIGGDAARRDAVYAGAGYLYALEGAEWKLSAYLKARNTDSADSLGFGAALSNDVAVLSANWESSNAKGINGDQSNNGAAYAGAVYVFQ